MGTKLWRWIAQPCRCVRELHWKPHHTHDPAGALIDVDHHVLCINLRVVEYFGHREYLPARHPSGIQSIDPMLLRIARQDLIDERIDLRARGAPLPCSLHV